MPLPADSILPLLPHTNLGESEHTQPKQALIIRLSEEVLDALQSYGGEKPPVEFDFGKSAGIYIGGTFYPMNGSSESGHELYLRSTSAKQHAPPLRHYANVTHKYAVELGQRAEAIAADNAIKRRRENAKQKEERQTILLDAPLPLTPTSSNTGSAPVKKKKKPSTTSMFRQVVKNSDKATTISRANAASASVSSTPTPTAATRVASPAPPKKREDLQDHPRRKPLIHCLAVNAEKSRDNLTKMILGGSAGNPSSQQDFHDLLEDVAEPTATLRKGEDPGNQRWRLKTESWTEVRPFEWPKWPETDRIAVARTGRQKLHALGMGPSDALWKHFEQPRQNTNNPMASTSSTSSSNSNPAPEPKRGLTSTDVEEKEKEKKKRPEPKEITGRDEGARALAGAPVAKTSSAMPNPKVKEESPRPQVPPQLRTGAGGKKLPGSGYKASNLASPAASPSPTSLSAPQPSDPRSRPGRDTPSSALPPKPPKPPKPSSASTTPSAKPDRNPVTGLPNKRIGKTRDVPNSGADSDRERASDRMDTGKSRSIPDKGKGVDSRDSNSSLKRKQVTEDDDDDYEDRKARMAAKKRKVEGDATPMSTPPNVKDPKGRDLSLPKRPELTPGAKPKPKKEASPLPPLPASPKIKKEREQSPAVRASMSRDRDLKGASPHRRSESVKTNGSGKSRRRSPIYTSSSSEDEGEIRRPSKPAATTLPTPSPNGDHSTDHRPVKREPIPTDHAAIRVRYQEAWSEYYELYGQLRTQRLKIEKQMTRGHPASDSGEEILSNDELAAKTDKYQQLFKDLSTMREILGVQ